ncbi:ComF family protein [Actinomyces slackii]|uniref:DNA utilization protein GntX n=1 Tax=Actinomyces slackii TaxID=52774 RepID=A0A448KG13_9ACTO|nr:phosphoribosyltransferase family protein [Actinomyces slackii]VEG75832.1 DNA utilization protein GntX [Actinomyces slackii]
MSTARPRTTEPSQTPDHPGPSEPSALSGLIGLGEPSGFSAARPRPGAGPLGLVLPVVCAGCGRWDTAICPQCRAALGADPHPVDHAEAAGDLPVLAGATYAGAVRHLVLAWKSGAREDLDAIMSQAGQALGRAWASLHPPAAVPEPSGSTGALLVVPAPSGPLRRLRGRLVAARLADAVARAVAAQWSEQHPQARLVLSADILRRPLAGGAHQSGRSARGRRVNRARAPRVLADVRGLEALIVDDVVTTGATLGSCHEALRRQGASVLGALALAATPPAHGLRTTGARPRMAGRELASRREQRLGIR